MGCSTVPSTRILTAGLSTVWWDEETPAGTVSVERWSAIAEFIWPTSPSPVAI